MLVLGEIFNFCLKSHLQEPEKYKGDEGYKQAFLDAIAEYNCYGISVSNPKYRVDDQQALDLYGFKAALLETLNCWLNKMIII